MDLTKANCGKLADLDPKILQISTHKLQLALGSGKKTPHFLDQNSELQYRFKDIAKITTKMVKQNDEPR